MPGPMRSIPLYRLATRPDLATPGMSRLDEDRATVDAAMRTIFDADYCIETVSARFFVSQTLNRAQELVELYNCGRLRLNLMTPP